jgi:hypothetical protein
MAGSLRRLLSLARGQASLQRLDVVAQLGNFPRLLCGFGGGGGEKIE